MRDGLDEDGFEIDPDIADLLPGYVEKRLRDVERARTLLSSSESDLSELRTMGHNMKGTGSTYGLGRVSEMGAHLEQAAVSRDLARAERTLDALQVHLVRVRARLSGERS